MTTLLYIDAFAGLAGDMFLGALADLGASKETYASLPGRLGLKGASIRIEDVKRKGIAAKRAIVEFPHEHVHRRLSDIDKILSQSDLPESVTRGSLATFRRLAEAEAKVHGTTPEEVHFHEVGAVDAILDIVGTHLAVHELGIERVVCSPIPLSRGEGSMAHGKMPLPAPATVEILEGVPTTGIDVDFETVTPTGASLAVTLADSYGDWPEMKVEACGWGAGTHEGGELPNLLRLIKGESRVGISTDRVWVLECEVDDMNPQFMEPLWDAAFKAGALDLYLTPVQMKKGRPGTLLTLLVHDLDRETCETLLLEHTTTLGVRRYLTERTILEREIHEVETEYGTIPIKVGKGMSGKAAPEAAAICSVAQAVGLPMSVIYEAALAAWRKRETDA